MQRKLHPELSLFRIVADFLDEDSLGFGWTVRIYVQHVQRVVDQAVGLIGVDELLGNGFALGGADIPVKRQTPNGS